MWLICHLSLQLWHIRYAYPPAEDVPKSPGENKCQWLIELFKMIHFELIVGVGTERAAQLWNYNIGDFPPAGKNASASNWVLQK